MLGLEHSIDFQYLMWIQESMPEVGKIVVCSIGSLMDPPSGQLFS